MSRPSTVRSRVALLLCVALVVTLISPSVSAPVPKPETAARVRVAVGACSDAANAGMPGLAELLERSLRMSFADQPALELVPIASGQAERVVSARIAALTAGRGDKAGRIEVIAESTVPATGRVAYRTVVSAQGTRRPGESRVAQLERAVGQAAHLVAAQVAQAETLRIFIASVSDRRVVVDHGSTDGIVHGTQLDVIRDGQVIGHIIIDSSTDEMAKGRLFDVEPDIEIVAGDEARLSEQELPAPPPPKKHRNTSGWIAAALIVGTLIAVAVSNSGGDDGPTGAELFVTSDVTQLPADGTSSARITATAADSNGNPLPDDTIVRFRTTRGLIFPAQVPLKSGQAIATLKSTAEPGLAVVTASVGKTSATVDVQFVEPTEE